MSANMAERKALARVTGRVQGVWFRAWTKGEAQKRGLSGWVRNEPDGSVTVFASGKAEAVEDLLAALWQGPPAARVDGVAVEQSEGGGESDGGSHTGGFTITG